MASILAKLPPPPVVIIGGKLPLLTTSFQNVTMPAFRGRQRRSALFTKATKDTSESSNSPSVFNSVQNIWETPEDLIALIGLGFAAIAGLWTAINVVTVIDKLPLIPSVLELVGILFSSWFVYRYLLFKPDREELFLSIKKSISDILGGQ